MQLHVTIHIPLLRQAYPSAPKNVFKRASNFAGFLQNINNCPARLSSTISKSKLKYLPTHHVVEDVENLSYYEPGGFHPTNIGDQLTDRYRIVHKLGFGTFSTIWLARDAEKNRLVAIKIARADSTSREVDILALLHKTQKPSKLSSGLNRADFVAPTVLDTFEIDGPNGRHSCSVTEVAACDLSSTKGGGFGGLFPLEVARALAAQLAYAVAFVHSCGLVHGDLHLGNVLLKLPRDIQHFCDDKLYQEFWPPEYEQVVRFDGQPLKPGVPTHAIPSLWLGKSSKDMTLADARIVLADFGASFSPAQASRCYHLAPTVVCPPEAWFETEMPASFASDIWTLGCALWNIVAFRPPFDNFFGSKDDTIFEQISALGPLPDKWWKQWEGRGKLFSDAGDPMGERDLWPLEQRFEESSQQMRQKKGWPIVSDEEKSAFLSIIRPMFSYNPKDRPSVEQVLASEWIQNWAVPAYCQMLKEPSSSEKP